jgi:hypothetical protein
MSAPATTSLADAYRDGYRDALDELLDVVAGMVADVRRGLFTLDETLGRLARDESWLVVPFEYADDEPVQPCADCGRDTLGTSDHDYYMVRDEVWAAAGMPATDPFRDPHQPGVFLHRRCLEKRLGRQLVRDDYTSAPVNAPILRELEREAVVPARPERVDGRANGATS